MSIWNIIGSAAAGPAVAFAIKIHNDVDTIGDVV